MKYLKNLKDWAEKSTQYLRKNDNLPAWYLFSNPFLFPVKVNSQRIKSINRFSYCTPTTYLKEISTLILRFFRTIVSLFVSIFNFRKRKLSVRSNCDGIIISHIGLAKHDKLTCPYFGLLAQALEKKGISVDMLFVDHTRAKHSIQRLNK